MRTLVAAAVACSILVSLSQAQSTEASIKKIVNIEAQTLSAALKEFARERELYLIFDDGDVVNHRTTGAMGEMTQDEVLGQLLKDSGLTYRYLDEKTVTIVPMATGPAIKVKDDTASAVEEAQKSRSFWDRFRVAQANSGNSGVKEDGDSTKLEEIVVTAQKREERLSDVPLSVEVLSGDALDTSTSQGIAESIREVPSVSMLESIFGGTSSIAIRGVSAGQAFRGSSTSAYYLDSAPFALVKSALVPDANAYDLERIEVVRGPQGTLYGANAENGVVRVITHDADVSDFDLKTRVSASSIQDGGENYRGDLAVNVPIIDDVLGARLVLGRQDLGGWIDRTNNDDGNTSQIDSARLRVRAEPTPNLTLAWSSWISRTDFDNPSQGDEDNTNIDVRNAPGFTNFDVHSLQAGYDFSAFTLTSTTSYLEFENESTVLFEQFGVPGIDFLTIFESQIFSQEVLLNSASSDRFKWTLGAFYRDGEDRMSQVTEPVIFQGVDFQNASQSYAAFGQIGGHFTPTLEWEAGLRYFHDSVSVDENVSSIDPPQPLIRASDDFSKVTPRVSLTWHPTPQATLYGSYSQGFRSGFPQDPGITRSYPQIPPAKPETLNNYEVGSHVSVLDGRVRIDAAAYYIDWQDVQQIIGVRTGPGPTQFSSAIINSESASGEGLDLAITVQPAERLSISLSSGWNNLQFDADVFSSEVLLYSKGDRLNNSPELTAAASLDYSFPLTNGFEGRFGTSVSYADAQGAVSLLDAARDSSVGNPIFTSDARFEVHAPSNWTATLFVNNLANENPILTEYELHFSSWSTRMRPRTIGLQLEYRFN